MMTEEMLTLTQSLKKKVSTDLLCFFSDDFQALDVLVLETMTQCSMLLPEQVTHWIWEQNSVGFP